MTASTGKEEAATRNISCSVVRNKWLLVAALFNLITLFVWEETMNGLSVHACCEFISITENSAQVETIPYLPCSISFPVSIYSFSGEGD